MQNAVQSGLLSQKNRFSMYVNKAETVNVVQFSINHNRLDKKHRHLSIVVINIFNYPSFI